MQGQRGLLSSSAGTIKLIVDVYRPNLEEEFTDYVDMPV
jgi:hypothetical protein